MVLFQWGERPRSLECPNNKILSEERHISSGSGDKGDEETNEDEPASYRVERSPHGVLSG